MRTFRINLTAALFILAFLTDGTSAFAGMTAPRSDLIRPSSSSARMTPSSSVEKSEIPPTRSASAVIFDIDGTLADSWKLGYDATVMVLNTNDLGHVEMSEKIYHEHCVYATPERLARHAGLAPGHPDFEVVGERLAREFDENYVTLVSRETAGFYDGIFDILQSLPEGIELGALTNACAAYGHAVIRSNCPVSSKRGGFALYDRFGTIHGADTVPEPKPSPTGLLQCAQEIKVDPTGCVYIGDAPGDGRAAKAAGMVSIGVLWGSNSEQKMRDANTFDYLCRTVEELKALLPQV